MRKTVSLMLLLFLLTTGCNNDDENNNGNPAMATFTVTIKNVAQEKSFIDSGVFNTPVDGDPGPAKPGQKYEFTFNAGRTQSLSFVTMLAATNDLFFGPGDSGIALYDANGDAISGDVTDQVYLWDAGTEVNEEPAVGPNTVTNQETPNTGEDENGNVMKIEDVTNGFEFDYPDVSEMIRVTITHGEGTEFTVTIEDLAGAKLDTSEGEVPAPISPGVWVIHNGDNPLYTEGSPDPGQGVEAIAEDGNPSTLGTYVEDNTGVTYPVSPGVWVVHTEGAYPLFTEGEVDYGDGLEAIAEDGNESVLGGNINSLDGVSDGAVFNTPEGADGPGPLLPEHTYKFSFEAGENESLSFVTMLAATNDVFIGTSDTGIPLFDSNGDPISGDITSKLYLWDAGTEVNEQPAVGPNTVTNQLAVDTGLEEEEPVSLLSEVDDGYTYPSVSQVVEVTITSN